MPTPKLTMSIGTYIAGKLRNKSQTTEWDKRPLQGCITVDLQNGQKSRGFLFMKAFSQLKSTEEEWALLHGKP